MHKLFLFVLLIASISVFSQSQRKIVQWIPLAGWTHPTVKAYIDRESTWHDEESDYGYGIILLVNPVAAEIDNGFGKKILVKSIARYLVADCANGVIAPLKDFYFNGASLPLLTDKPLSAIDYSGKLDIKPISKKSPIFLALCPNYI